MRTFENRIYVPGFIRMNLKIADNTTIGSGLVTHFEVNCKSNARVRFYLDTYVTHSLLGHILNMVLDMDACFGR